MSSKITRTLIAVIAAALVPLTAAPASADDDWRVYWAKIANAHVPLLESWEKPEAGDPGVALAGSRPTLEIFGTGSYRLVGNATGREVVLASGKVTSDRDTHKVALPVSSLKKASTTAMQYAGFRLVVGPLSISPAELEDPRYADVVRRGTVKIGAVKKAYSVPKKYRKRLTWAAGSPSRWNPCRAITYKVSTKYLPKKKRKAALADTRRAFAEVSKRTGVSFRYAGTTTKYARRASFDRLVTAQTNTVIVHWGDASSTGSAMGYGGAYSVELPSVGQSRSESGAVLMSVKRDNAKFRRQILMHEIGHAVGLGHSNNRSDLMYGTATSKNRKFSSLERRALKNMVGRNAGCL